MAKKKIKKKAEKAFSNKTFRHEPVAPTAAATDAAEDTPEASDSSEEA